MKWSHLSQESGESVKSCTACRPFKSIPAQNVIPPRNIKIHHLPTEFSSTSHTKTRPSTHLKRPYLTASEPHLACSPHFRKPRIALFAAANTMDQGDNQPP